MPIIIVDGRIRIHIYFGSNQPKLLFWPFYLILHHVRRAGAYLSLVIHKVRYISLIKKAGGYI